MAMVDADWTVDRDSGNIRYIGGDHADSAPSYATVIEFHRWLQALADDAVAVGDDELDITNINPSSRSTDNIITLLGDYNIDATASEHLYDGSIIQDSGDTIYDGIVNFGNLSVQIQIIQDGQVLADDWWNYAGGGLNADSNAGISHRFMLKVREYGVDIDGRRLLGTSRTFGKTYHEFPINGTARGNNVLALSNSDDLNNDTVEGTVSGWTTITNTEGLRAIDVNDDGTTEQYYSEWNRDTYTINQFYERMKWLTRDGTSSTINGLNGELIRGITHSFEYDGETGGAPTTNDEYAWGTAIAYTGESGGPFTVGEVVWENSSSTPEWKGQIVAVDDDGATGTIIVRITNGTVSDTDPFIGKTSGATATANGTPTAVSGGGTFRFFAVDDQGSNGYVYGQIMTGTFPAENTRMYDDTDVSKYFDVNNASAFPVTSRSVSTPFCGQSTGSALIGAYGFGVEKADLSNTDSVTALDGVVYSPPVLTTNTVGGLVLNEDYVLVAPWDGSTYDAEVTGTLDGGNALKDCLVTNINYVNGFIEQCIIGTGTITLGGGFEAHFLDCWSGAVGGTTPIVDMGGSGQGLAMRNYTGAIKLQNKTGPEKIQIDLSSGECILASTVTAGEITVRGVGKLVDESGEGIVSGVWNGATIVNELVNNPAISTAVWNKELP